jgi:hypothetical protein
MFKVLTAILAAGLGLGLNLNVATAENCTSDESRADRLEQIPPQSMPSVGHPEQGAATGQFGVRKFHEQTSGQLDTRYEGYMPKEQGEAVATNMQEATEGQAESVALDETPYQVGSGYTSLEQNALVIVVARNDQTASAEEESTPDAGY